MSLGILVEPIPVSALNDALAKAGWDIIDWLLSVSRSWKKSPRSHCLNRLAYRYPEVYAKEIGNGDRHTA